MTRVKKEQLLLTLETVRAGLSPKPMLEQSDCFVFKGGSVYTFNEEIACRVRSPLPETFEGAVKAPPLLAVLAQMPDKQVEVGYDDGRLAVRGSNRVLRVRMDKEIRLPIDKVERPGKEDWSPLAPDFADAVAVVADCVTRNQALWMLTNVHVTPKWIEASDKFQAARYRTKTGLKQDSLVRGESLKHVIPLGMSKVAETGSWLHFRGASGLTLSCRRFAEAYRDLSEFLESSGGEKVSLPAKPLVRAAKSAEVFSKEDADNNKLKIDLRPSPGRLRLSGNGSSGSYEETMGVNYNGPAMSFLIAPTLLAELCGRQSDCEVGEKFIRVSGGRFVYVACLTRTEGNAKKKEKS